MDYRIQQLTSSANYIQRGIFLIPRDQSAPERSSAMNPAKRFCRRVHSPNMDNPISDSDCEMQRMSYSSEDLRPCSSSSSTFDDDHTSVSTAGISPSTDPIVSDDSCNQEIDIDGQDFNHCRNRDYDTEYDSGHSPVSDRDSFTDYEHARLRYLIQDQSKYLRGLTLRIDDDLSDELILDDWDGKKRVLRIGRRKYDSYFIHHPKMQRRFSTTECGGPSDHDDYKAPMNTRQQQRIESAITELEYYVLKIINPENLLEVIKLNHYNNFLLSLIHKFEEQEMKKDGHEFNSE